VVVAVDPEPVELITEKEVVVVEKEVVVEEEVV